MHEIPQPQVLDPDRPLRRRGTELTADDRPEAELLSQALHETCQYAEQLWNELNGVRAYLLNSLPPDPRAPGAHPSAAASPTGPDDDTGWENWVTAFATVSSVLCGPQGDSGFGLGTAREHAQLRRTAPVLTLQAEHPYQSASPKAPPEPTPEPASPTATTAPTTPSTAPRPAADVARRENIRNALTIALAVLALRGLRPRRAVHGAGGGPRG